MRLAFAVLFMILAGQAIQGQGTAQPKTPVPTMPKDDILRIHGKTFEQWVKEIGSKDPSKRETAIRTVVAFPPEISIKAAPALVAELRRHGPSTPVDLSVRVNLCMALNELFTCGEKFDPKLEAEVVNLVVRQLRDTQSIMRYRAVQTLGTIGPTAKGTLPDIFIMLKDYSTWECRQAAASALGQIAGDVKNGPPVAVLQALYSLLNDQAYQVRLAAIQSLTILGPPADPALVVNFVKSLEPVALKDPEVGLQIWARVAILGATSNFTSDMIAPISKHLTAPDPLLRTQAVQALGTIGPKAKSTIPGLITTLADEEQTVAAYAMWALGRMETSAVNALPVLEKIAADPNKSDFLKRSAKDAMEKIKGR